MIQTVQMVSYKTASPVSARVSSRHGISQMASGQLLKALSEGSVVQCLSHGTPYACHLSRCLLSQQLSFNAWRPRLSAMSGISCLATAQGASLDIICSAQQNHKLFEETHKLEDAISISRACGSWLCTFSHELDVCSA